MHAQDEDAAKLLGSLLLFTQTFFKLRTGREFVISQPVSNESHFITVCRDLTKVFRLEVLFELINLPPGWAKSELCKHFCAWAIAHYADCNFLYISNSHDLAAKHTHGIKQIIELPQYRKMFHVEISRDSSAKDYFRTTQGGVIAAFGAKGGIVGHDAGLPNVDRFSGAIIMDDMHKNEEVHSDTIRTSVIRNYFETIKPRRRSQTVPIVFIGQRLHEDDLPAHLIANKDGNNWNKLIIKALDDVGNARYPEVHPKEFLLNEEKTSPYVYASQYQQNPQPSGGGIFKEKWFVLLEEEPKMLATFITVDTAETDKTYNDATVFSFWGLYKIEEFGVETDIYALHWIDCLEDWLEPKDLESAFRQFVAECMRHKVKPTLAAIEKKSTGTTLISMLNGLRGINIVDVERNRSSGSKTARFLESQPYVASKLISFPVNGKHTHKCIDHMRKITANNSHRYDDIADTCADAIKLGLVDNVVLATAKTNPQNLIVAQIAQYQQQQNQIRGSMWQR